jgi:hypothetical protein
MKITKIDKFESLNNQYAINVFGSEGKPNDICPLRISKAEGIEIDLLLYNGHYCLIKDFGRLVNSQLSKDGHKRFHCKRCLSSFTTELAKEDHAYYCKHHEPRRVIVDGKPVKFVNYNRSMRVPFAIYADFESFIKPIVTCQNNPEKSFTNKYQQHVPSSFAFYVKGPDGIELQHERVSYTAKSDDDNVAVKFVEYLEKYVKYLYNKFETHPKDMIFTDEDIINYHNSTHCHICEGELDKLPNGYKPPKTPPKITPERKVRDHCHITGKYRGAAHSFCNLNYRLPKFYPVIMHNLSGYDAHLFIKELARDHGEISCIPNTDEKYITFDKAVQVGEYTDKDGKAHPIKRQLKFIDSFKFMASSLDNLLKNVKDHPNLERYFSG